MHLATATKVRAAGVLYRVVSTARRLVGRSPNAVVCRRGHLIWSLNLQDGIQLSIYLCGAFARATARTLSRLRPRGGVAIDVGANIGAHTLPLARHAGESGRVIAIEPTAWAVEGLRRNLALNAELSQRVIVHA